MKSFLKSIQIGAKTVGRLLRYLWNNKLWWLIPMIVLFVVLFTIIIFAQSSPLGPFIYVIF